MNSIDSKLVSLKTQITLTRQKLNQAWAVNQMTDTTVLEVGTELDKLCNEYERLLQKRRKRGSNGDQH